MSIQWGDLITVMVPLIGGGILGTVLTLLYKRGEKRTDIAIKLIDQFFERYEKLGEVYSLFNMEWDPQENHEDKVRMMGDWFEIFSALYNNRKADRNLLDSVGFPKIISRFYRKAELDDRLQDTIQWWPEMERYVKEFGG
jgi:hypothetical protein